MGYWIVMILLIGGSIALLAKTYIDINNTEPEDMPPEGRRRRRRETDDEYGDGDEPDVQQVRRSRREDAAQQEEAGVRRRKKRRQWKIILENIDSWEKYTFIFYKNVGIGRGKDGSRYEQYLMIRDDGRISKMHCAIVSRGDKLYLRDENSRNGTYLNGTRIEKPIVIQKDDVIGVGGTRLEVQRVMRESDQWKIRKEKEAGTHVS